VVDGIATKGIEGEGERGVDQLVTSQISTPRTRGDRRSSLLLSLTPAIILHQGLMQALRYTDLYVLTRGRGIEVNKI
jgi:hypothetical protein